MANAFSKFLSYRAMKKSVSGVTRSMMKSLSGMLADRAGSGPGIQKNSKGDLFMLTTSELVRLDGHAPQPNKFFESVASKVDAMLAPFSKRFRGSFSFNGAQTIETAKLVARVVSTKLSSPRQQVNSEPLHFVDTTEQEEVKLRQVIQDVLGRIVILLLFRSEVNSKF